MRMYSRLKEKHWGDEAIKAIVCAIIAAICLAIGVSATARNNKIENLAKSEFSCDEAVFGFNDDEATAKPLGYYVEARHYTDNGEMTKDYHYIQDGQKLYETYTRNVVIEGIFGFIFAITGFLTLVFIYFTIDGMIFIRKLNKKYDHDAKIAKDAA